MSAETRTTTTLAACAAAQEICRRRGPWLYFSAFFLPAPKRQAAWAIFAFGLMIRDALAPQEQECGPAGSTGGSCCDASGLDQRLEMLRERLDSLYADHPGLVENASQEEQIIGAVGAAVGRYSIPREHFLGFAQARRMESTVQRYATWNSLERYLARGGGSAALALAAVLGLTHSEAWAWVVDLGKAAALTRVLRDLQEDWQRGFLYLPQEDLARFRCREKDLPRAEADPRWRELLEFEKERARELYRSGARAIPWLAGDGSRLAGAMLVATGLAQLNGEKAGRARMLLQAWQLVRRAADEPLPRYFSPRESKSH